jgi:hypothetical protein
MASFVVGLGLTPADYWALTWAERNAIVREQNRAKRRKG